MKECWTILLNAVILLWYYEGIICLNIHSGKSSAQTRQEQAKKLKAASFVCEPVCSRCDINMCVVCHRALHTEYKASHNVTFIAFAAALFLAYFLLCFICALLGARSMQARERVCVFVFMSWWGEYWAFFSCSSFGHDMPGWIYFMCTSQYQLNVKMCSWVSNEEIVNKEQKTLIEPNIMIMRTLNMKMRNLFI